MRVGRYLGLGLTLLAMAACAAPKDRMVMLGDTLRAYERVVRWGNLAAAQQFRAVPETVDAQRFVGLRVTSYDVVYSRPEADGQGLTQTVTLTYFREDEGVQRSATDTQRWRWDGERKRWVLETPLPDFR